MICFSTHIYVGCPTSSARQMQMNSGSLRCGLLRACSSACLPFFPMFVSGSRSMGIRRFHVRPPSAHQETVAFMTFLLLDLTSISSLSELLQLLRLMPPKCPNSADTVSLSAPLSLSPFLPLSLFFLPSFPRNHFASNRPPSLARCVDCRMCWW